jgi:hypothetical protein
MPSPGHLQTQARQCFVADIGLQFPADCSILKSKEGEKDIGGFAPTINKSKKLEIADITCCKKTTGSSKAPTGI